MTSIRSVVLLSTILTLAGCAFGPTDAIQDGGSTSINGIDILSTAPARPYQVISVVSHEGPDDSASYTDEETLIAEDAQKAGADAAIILYRVKTVSRTNLANGQPIMAPKVSAQLIKYQ
jgi:hypothetical protein